MGCAGSTGNEVPEIQAANGPIRRGTRVQTQWDEGAGHDMQWYVGTVSAVYDTGKCTIDYDDPDKWTGDARWVFVLPPGHPGHTAKVATGSPTQAGPSGHVGSVAAAVGPPMMGQMQPMMGQMQPMMAQPMMAQPMMAQPMMCGGVAMAQPVMGAPQPQMTVMTVVATVPGGSIMQFQGPNGMPMELPVPMGVGVGQEFLFQMPAAGPVVAQGMPI